METKELFIAGKKAIRVKARIKTSTEKAHLVDYLMKKEWFPTFAVKDNLDGTLDIIESMFEEKFTNNLKYKERWP